MSEVPSALTAPAARSHPRASRFPLLPAWSFQQDPLHDGSPRLLNSGISWSVVLCFVDSTNFGDSTKARVNLIERLIRQVADLTEAKGPAQQASRRKKPSRWVPLDYVSCVDFASLHGIPISTMRQAIAEGRIAVQSGTWKWGGRIIREMLNEEGCAQFYERFHTHPRFQACEDCPHQRWGAW